MEKRTSALPFALYTYENIGTLDRLARTVLGAVLIGITLVARELAPLQLVMTLMAIPLVISAIMAWDPFYAQLGIRTATLRARKGDTWPLRAPRRSANAGINVGTMDRVGRTVLASALLTVPLVGGGAIEWVVVCSLTAIPVAMTAIMGWDPLYSVLGIRTATLPITTAHPYSLQEKLGVVQFFNEDAPVFHGDRGSTKAAA